jgi:cobalt/nickel transport system permease protein
MMLAHLAVAGVVELALTFGIVAYLQRANPALLRINPDNVAGAAAAEPVPQRFGWRWGVVALIVMGALTPLGLLAPGGAFGEGAPADLNLRKYHLSAVPNGLRHYAGFWHHALFSGYDFAGDRHPALGYLTSAAFGMVVIAALIFALLAVVGLVRRRRDERQPETQSVT